MRTFSTPYAMAGLRAGAAIARPETLDKFMLDVKRPGNEIIMALRTEKIYIGRVWPSWRTHVRVTIGTAEEMGKFKTALVKVMA